MTVKHTPGPWFTSPEGQRLICSGEQRTALMGDFRGSHVAEVLCNALAVREQDDTGAADRAEVHANAKLIAAAPDHALLLSAMARGEARWEPFNINTRFADTSRGELVFGGMRYSTALDDTGCPVVDDVIRAALARLS